MSPWRRHLFPSLLLGNLLTGILTGGLVGCAQEGELASQRDALASPHEPQIEIFWRRFRAFTPWTFTLDGLDRPFRLSYNWWSNGTDYPSLFRMIATSPSGVVTTSGEPSADPVLEAFPLPGETTLSLAVEHQSQAPEFLIHFLREQEVRPDELGACGDQMRDLFVRWVKSTFTWEHNVRITYLRETPPNYFFYTSQHGVSGTTQQFYLDGVLDGPMGPILAVRNIGDTRLRLNTLLFFDGQGQLVRKVDGRLYRPLPDGNLLVSSAMTSDGSGSSPWAGVREHVMSVDRTGQIVWQRFIDGVPPGRIVVTAAGNYVMPWSIYNGADRRGGAPVFDPATGATVDESFLDRGALCTTASTAEHCLATKARALAEFESWWAATWPTIHTSPYLASPYEVCNGRYHYCTATALAGWTLLGDELVFETPLNYRDSVGRTYRNRLHFVDATGTRRQLGGKFIRRLSAAGGGAGDRLLVSTAMADSGTNSSGTPWYGAHEVLASVGPRAQIQWQRAVGGQPAPLAARGTYTGSNGFLLPDNQLFWTAWETYEGTQRTFNVWLDLATGAVLPVPPKKQLEGVCKLVP